MYLESRLTQIGNSAARFEIEAGKIPTEASLPRADRDAMEEFLANVHIVLGSLGHRVLEPVNPELSNDSQGEEQSELSSYRLTFNVREIKAAGRFTDEVALGKAQRILRGESPCRVRVSHPPVSSVDLIEEWSNS